VPDILLRILVGGSIVSTFAVLSDLLKPKTSAGLFTAAPSVALPPWEWRLPPKVSRTPSLVPGWCLLARRSLGSGFLWQSGKSSHYTVKK
jgi:hypothetical protein